MDKMIYSCEMHIEELLDVFLDEVCEMPVMEKMTDNKRACDECMQSAMYRLSRSEVKATWE